MTRGFSATIALLFSAAAAAALPPVATERIDSVPRIGLIYECVFTDGAKDFSGSGLNGTLVGSAGIADGVLTTSQNPTGYVSLATSTNSLNFNYNSPHSIFARVKVNAFNSAADMIVARMIPPEYQGYSLSFITVSPITNGIRANVRYGPGFDIMVDSHQDIQTNAWVTVGYTYRGADGAGGMLVYAGGVTSSTRAVIGDNLGNLPTITATPTTIGCRGNGLLPLDGQIEWVRIWDRALTPEEVLNLSIGEVQ